MSYVTDLLSDISLLRISGTPATLQILLIIAALYSNFSRSQKYPFADGLTSPSILNGQAGPGLSLYRADYSQVLSAISPLPFQHKDPCLLPVVLDGQQLRYRDRHLFIQLSILLRYQISQTAELKCSHRQRDGRYPRYLQGRPMCESL